MSEGEAKCGLCHIIHDGLTTQIMSTLTGSTFLVAFAAALGASNLIIGLLAAIPALSSVIQIPAIYLVEKYGKRKSITVLASALSRSFLLVIACIPFVFPLTVALPLIMVALVLNSLLSAIGGCSWNSWMHDLVPKGSLGRFFSKRMLVAAAVGVPLSLAAGYFIDYWNVMFPASTDISMNLVGYTILFVGGFLSGIIGSLLVVSRIPEPERVTAQKIPPLGELIRQPFKDVNFKNLIIFLTSWSLAVNLATPFFTIYMLNSLGFNMGVIVLLSALSQITSLGFFRIWGSLSDRLSNKSVLRVSGPLMICTFPMWALTTFHTSGAMDIRTTDSSKCIDGHRNCGR